MKELLLPPVSLLLVAVVGGVVLRRRPRLGRWLIGLALAGLWVASTPVVGGLLLGSLQPWAPPVPSERAGAIVVLSAGLDVEAPEYGGPSVDALTLQRLRYAAALQRRTALPIAVTGGSVQDVARPIALAMADVLRDELGAEVRWVEDRAGTTWENAALTAALLRRDGVERAFVVTHAWHMPRAVQSFRAHGFDVVPAPTAFRGPALSGFASLVPSWKGMRDTSLALHEWLGRAWYWLRG